MLSVFLLEDGDDFYLFVDAAKFLLSGSWREKTRIFPFFFGCLPSSRVYLDQKYVFLAR